jgi:hypothetical protein
MLDRGAALVFTTSDDIAQLRNNVTVLRVPPFLEKTRPRSDNVPNGIRLVFELETNGDVPSVQRDVREQARLIAHSCSLVVTAPTDVANEEQPRAVPPAAVSPSAHSQTNQKQQAAKGKRKQSRADKPQGKKTAQPATKAEATKPAEKPVQKNKQKDSSKPKQDLLPKVPERPPLPRLPGPKPEPIAGRRALA